MSSQDLDQINDSTCKTNVKDCDRSQKMIDELDLDDDKGKNEKKYQDLVKSINYLKKFDWFDANNPQLKTPPIKLLTPAALWFMVCAEYFPRSLSIATPDPTQTLTDMLQKIERQQIQQTIRVKDMSYQNLKGEAVDEQSQEIIQKIKQAIKKFKYDKPQANIRNSAELKEDYTFEDDLYICSVRNDLLDLYSTYIHPEFLQANQQSCSSSDSTMLEEDSRHLYITKEELGGNGQSCDKTNPESTSLVVKELDAHMLTEEGEAKTANPEQASQQEDLLKEGKPEFDEVNEEQVEDMKIEIQVQNEGEERNFNEIDEEGQEQQQSDQNSEKKESEERQYRLNLPKLKERNFNQEEVLKAMKKQDLDEIINLYQLHLASYEKEMKSSVETLKKNIERDIENERFIYSPSELDMTDILVDIHQYNNIESEYLNFLENKQQFIDFESDRENENQNQKKQHVKQHDKIIMEDMACQICNDGDYTDDDLIVFCSKCNVSVHQRCYGIPKIPNDDWICELCLSFGPDGKYLRCALCTKRGGAMKPSKIPITSTIFQHTNTQYYEFQKTCKAGPPNKKQRYEDPNEKQSKPGSNSKQIAQENEEIEDENESNNQYYDFHYLKEFTEEELQKEPKPYFVWCHITCTLWTPECFFDDKNYYTNIKGLENIDKARYKLECSICKQKKAGSCVQCAKTKCMEAFHPECARRANIYMEVRNTDKLAYLTYCERHTPLKLRRHLEHKEKKYKEEIIKFCRSIERSREFRKKERNTKKERDRQLEKESKKVPIKKKILISAKKIRQQITKNEEESHKEEVEFQQMLIHKMITYIDNLKDEDLKRINSESNIKKSEESSEKQTVSSKITEKDQKLNKNDPKSAQKINRWQNKIFKRYKRIQRDKTKKKTFKQIYLKTLSVVKNIRIVSKEERLKEKELKKIEKQQKRQQKINEIFLKTQEREKKKEELQKKKELKEDIKKQKEATKFELSKSAIRRTNKKRDKINDKKQQKLAKQNEAIEQIMIVPHNYEPVDETSEQTYCVCKRKYQEGDQMMACEKCDEWYHFECIGFNGTIDQAENLDFVCKFCDHKDTNAQQRKERKQNYGHLFISYDEPTYEMFKDVLTKKQKIEEEQQALEEEVEATTSRKRASSKSSNKQSSKKQTQKNNKKSSSKKQEKEGGDQTTTSKKTRKQNEKNANTQASKISEVKAKLEYNNYSDAKEEIFEDDEDDENENQQMQEEGIYDNEINQNIDEEEKDDENQSTSNTNQNKENEEKIVNSIISPTNQSSSSSEISEENNKEDSQQQSQQQNNEQVMDEEKQIPQEAPQVEESEKLEEPVESIIQQSNISPNCQEEQKSEVEQINKIDSEDLVNEDKTDNIDALDEFAFKGKAEKSESFASNDKNVNHQSPSQENCNLSKQNSNVSTQNCNVNNIDAFKFKQKSIKDFFKKK